MGKTTFNFASVASIGIVCSDCLRLSPTAAVLLRFYLSRSSKADVRRIQVANAGLNRTSHKASNRAIGYLQKKGFGAANYLDPERVDRNWLEKKDLVVTMDRFLKRNIVYDFFPTRAAEMREKVFTLPEIASIDSKIRDPGEDRGIEITPVFDLIEKCCIELVKKLEKAH